MPKPHMSAMKQFIVKIVRWLAAPWRKRNHVRYAEPADDGVERRELPNELFLPVVAESIAEGHAVIIAVKGYSMRPFLEHLRDKVELSPWTDLQVGDAVLAEIAKGHFVLHRIVLREGDQLTLRGDGNLRGTEHCTVADVRGVVTKYIRPGGHILQASDTRLRRRIAIWGSLPAWIRRIGLLIYKATI